MSQHGVVEAKVKPVIAWQPVDINGSGGDGDWVSMANYRRCIAVVMHGTDGAASAITLQQATDSSGSGAKALSFDEQWADTDTTSGSLLTKTTVTSDTFNSAGSANTMYAIEINAIDLDQANGFDYIRVRKADGSAAAICGALYIMLDPRYVDTTAIDPTS